eukprot:16267780-Heterocapsa_arctica.AAC.1
MNLKRVLRYLISTRDYVLHLEVDPTKEENFLSVEVDASWANAAACMESSAVLWLDFRLRCRQSPETWVSPAI